MFPPWSGPVCDMFAVAVWVYRQYSILGGVPAIGDICRRLVEGPIYGSSELSVG